MGKVPKHALTGSAAVLWFRIEIYRWFISEKQHIATYVAFRPPRYTDTHTHAQTRTHRHRHPLRCLSSPALYRHARSRTDTHAQTQTHSVATADQHSSSPILWHPSLNRGTLCCLQCWWLQQKSTCCCCSAGTLQESLGPQSLGLAQGNLSLLLLQSRQHLRPTCPSCGT